MHHLSITLLKLKEINVFQIGINVDIPATCVYLSSTADCFDQLTK